MKDNGLLIAALVAIVAVVGLVILFQGNATGNQIIIPEHTLVNPGVLGEEAAYAQGVAIGETVAQDCIATYDTSWQQCCSMSCTDNSLDRSMFRGCSYICQLRVAQAASPYIDLV